MHTGLMPFLHLQLPGDESQQAMGNTNVQESEAAVPNNKSFTSIFNEAPALPALQREKQHTLCKSLGKVHVATH